MYIVLIILELFLMNWYITKIVFNIAAENSINQFDEQLRLISAENQEEAFLKARAIGLREEDIFYNNNLKEVKWEFVNVAEIIHINTLEDGTELYSRIHETEEPTSYINFVHKKAVALRKNSTLFH